jgi:hypothetical protein
MTRLPLIGLVLVAACSSGSGTSGHPADQGVVDASSTASQIGCTSFEEDAAADRELFVADSGTCSLDGAQVTVYRFSNEASRDNWIKAASGAGIGRYVVFDRGVVTSDSQESADAISAKVGGEIRTG